MTTALCHHEITSFLVNTWITEYYKVDRWKVEVVNNHAVWNALYLLKKNKQKSNVHNCTAPSRNCSRISCRQDYKKG